MHKAEDRVKLVQQRLKVSSPPCLHQERVGMSTSINSIIALTASAYFPWEDDSVSRRR